MRSPTANKNSWEDLWRNAAMQSSAYAASLDGMTAYANKIKADNSAGWGYAIFVTKYPKDWFGYEWGNHVVMDFTVATGVSPTSTSWWRTKPATFLGARTNMDPVAATVHSSAAATRFPTATASPVRLASCRA